MQTLEVTFPANEHDIITISLDGTELSTPMLDIVDTGPLHLVAMFVDSKPVHLGSIVQDSQILCLLLKNRSGEEITTTITIHLAEGMAAPPE